MNDPVKIDAEPSRRERKKINQWYYHADSNEHKIKLLARFIETEKVSRGIVFVRRREDVRELSETLRKRGIRSTYLEGDMAQTQRNNAIDKLKSGVVTVLVATDVAARGIDIDDVTHVMNSIYLTVQIPIYIVLVVLLAQGKRVQQFLLLKPMIIKLLGKIKTLYGRAFEKHGILEGFRTSH